MADFKSILKKIGEIILKGKEIIPIVGPFIKAYAPDNIDKVVDVASLKLDELGRIVITTEAIGQALGLSGEDKLKAAIPLFGQVVMQSALIGGKRIDDEVLYNEGLKDLTNGVVKIMNSVKADG
jgi:hypothetical protein